MIIIRYEGYLTSVILALMIVIINHHNHHNHHHHHHHHHHNDDHHQHGAMQAAWLEPDLALLLPKIQGERQQWKRHQVTFCFLSFSFFLHFLSHLPFFLPIPFRTFSL